MPATDSRSLLVTDFDGTMSTVDFFELAVSRYLEPGTPDYWTKYVAGEISHFQAMQSIYSHIRCSERELLHAVEDMHADPAIPQALSKLDAVGWDVVVVSNGCSWYIDRIFRELGVNVPVYTNPGHFDERRGLLLEAPADSPFYAPSHGIDKAAVVRDAFTRHHRVAFAGNGPPDIAAAQLVDPQYRFATGWLAGELKARGIPYQSFQIWSEIATRLAPDTSPVQAG